MLGASANSGYSAQPSRIAEVVHGALPPVDRISVSSLAGGMWFAHLPASWYCDAIAWRSRTTVPSVNDGDERDVAPIRVVERAFAVLHAIGAESEGASVAQIMARTGLPVVTVHRLVRTLQALGYAEQAWDTGRWHVGLRVLDLRGRVTAVTKLAALGRPFLKDLMLSSGGRANLAMFREGEVVYVDIVRDLRSLDTYVPPGSRNRAHCTALGKVFLAELSDEQLARIVEEKGLPPQTDRTITTLDALTRELEAARTRGYATEIGEAAETSRCFAAPVRDYTERVVAAISVSGDAQRFPDDRFPELIALVQGAGRRLSARLGFEPDALSTGATLRSEPIPLTD